MKVINNYTSPLMDEILNLFDMSNKAKIIISEITLTREQFETLQQQDHFIRNIDGVEMLQIHNVYAEDKEGKEILTHKGMKYPCRIKIEYE